MPASCPYQGMQLALSRYSRSVGGPASDGCASWPVWRASSQHKAPACKMQLKLHITTPCALARTDGRSARSGHARLNKPPAGAPGRGAQSAFMRRARTKAR